jgi:membrane-associated phospholipid phosphatase
MRPLPLLVLAILAFAVSIARATAQDSALRPVLVWGGAFDAKEPCPTLHDRPIFPAQSIDADLSVEPSADRLLGPEDGEDMPQMAEAAPAANPASPVRPRGEPVLNGDNWLNVFWDIPRFFTAPTRFDTEDWIKTGAFVAAAGAAFAADEDLRRFFRHNRSQIGDSIAAIGYRLGDGKTILGASALAYGAGYAAGDVKSRETALLVLQSWALTAGATEGVKQLAGRKRPGSTDDHAKFEGPGGSEKSFWSGHAANAFSTAAVIAEQYHDNPWVAPVAYGLAGLVAWSRLNDNAHWASDVVVGAGFGYAVGKLVTHFSPFRDQPEMSLMPWGLPGGGGLQLGFRF